MIRCVEIWFCTGSDFSGKVHMSHVSNIFDPFSQIMRDKGFIFNKTATIKDNVLYLITYDEDKIDLSEVLKSIPEKDSIEFIHRMRDQKIEDIFL